MDSVVKSEQQSRWQFSFHGCGGEYFIICLTNIVLCIITLGLFIPWAMVRSRRYIYENMELNGARFGYHATGMQFFLSFLFCICFLVGSVLAINDPFLKWVILLIELLVFPFLIVKSIKYNAMMTTLNNVRFNYHYSAGRVWWVIVGLPLVLLSLLVGAIVVVVVIPVGEPNSTMAVIKKVVLALVVSLVGTGIVTGTLYAKWIAMLGAGSQFGTQRFSVAVSVKQCIKICLLSTLIMIVFLAIIAWIFYGILLELVSLNVAGNMSDEMKSALLLSFRGQIFSCYLLYFVALLLSIGYMWMALRNHVINNLTLADGAVRFHSSIAFHALVLQWVLIAVVSFITLGLAYPLLKMRYLRFLAASTWVEGDLDTLDLSDHDEQPESGPIAVLSRGVMPQIPFI